MLYENWRRVARSCRNDMAVHDLATGRRWTFAELAAAAENGVTDQSPLAFPEGQGAEFIVGVLRAWRFNQPACPLEPAQKAPRIEARLPRGIAHLKTTSGTTGMARLVAFTGSQLQADIDNIAATMGLRRDWPNLGVVSMAHSYGFSNLVLALLLHGVPLVLVGAALPEAVRRAAATQEAVTLASVPALWRMWHAAKAIPPNVRLAICAGAPLPLALEHDVFGRHGLKLHNFYGSSECGGIAYDASAKPRADASWVGTALRNVELSVGESGCLDVRSRAVARGYWPEAGVELGRGVFHSKDLAEISNGRIFLRGRASDQINVAGRKVSPETIEAALAKHPCVSECVVFGIPSVDGERGERIVACLAVKAKISGEALKHFLMERLPAWQVPREWRFVDALETNRRGKLPRAEWRRLYFES
jgi:long-chain acyl-CoA synthetase